jgi:hypothetical protein
MCRFVVAFGSTATVSLRQYFLALNCAPLRRFAFIADTTLRVVAVQSIFGHSMGGHGALICGLKNPVRDDCLVASITRAADCHVAPGLGALFTGPVPLCVRVCANLPSSRGMYAPIAGILYLNRT